MGLSMLLVVSGPRLPVPVDGPVVRRFDPPACHYCAGHRGVTVASEPGSPVTAIVDGEVTFSGQVAGVLYVVMSVSPGVLLTHGGLSSIEEMVESGSVVRAGQTLGWTGRTTHLGVRIEGEYHDPLAVFGWGRARLIGPGGIDVVASAAAR